MNELLTLIQNKREEILALAANYGAYNVRLFGSVLHGDYNDKSDVDFLVDFKPNVNLLTWSQFWLELETLLGRKVDIAEAKSLKPKLRETILREALIL